MFKEQEATTVPQKTILILRSSEETFPSLESQQKEYSLHIVSTMPEVDFSLEPDIVVVNPFNLGFGLDAKNVLSSLRAAFACPFIILVKGDVRQEQENFMHWGEVVEEERKILPMLKRLLSQKPSPKKRYKSPASNPFITVIVVLATVEALATYRRALNEFNPETVEELTIRIEASQKNMLLKIHQALTKIPETEKGLIKIEFTYSYPK